MNSLKSVCSFAKSTPVPLDQFQQHLQPVFRRKFSVELIIGQISVLETAEHVNNAIHECNLARGGDLHHVHADDEENAARTSIGWVMPVRPVHRRSTYPRFEVDGALDDSHLQGTPR